MTPLNRHFKFFAANLAAILDFLAVTETDCLIGLKISGKQLE